MRCKWSKYAILPQPYAFIGFFMHSSCHGAAASRVARETAAKFQFKGDTEGHVVWGRVADAVERRSLTSIVGESVTPLS